MMKNYIDFEGRRIEKSDQSELLIVKNTIETVEGIVVPNIYFEEDVRKCLI